MLSYQVALVFTGRSQWIWCGILKVLILGFLIYWMGVFFGLAYTMTPTVGCIIFPVYVIVKREQERERTQSQKILEELQEKHFQLELYSPQVQYLDGNF